MSNGSKKDGKSQKSWWTGVKAEFKKIIWPDQKTLVKETTAAISVSVLLGVLISVIDVFIKYGIDFLIK